MTDAVLRGQCCVTIVHGQVQCAGLKATDDDVDDEDEDEDFA